VSLPGKAADGGVCRPSSRPVIVSQPKILWNNLEIGRNVNGTRFILVRFAALIAMLTYKEAIP
jgi:hypothetical protein